MEMMGSFLLALFSFCLGGVSVGAFNEWRLSEKRKRQIQQAFNAVLKEVADNEAVARMQWCETQIEEAQWQLLQRRLGQVFPPADEMEQSLLCVALNALCDKVSCERAATTGRISLCDSSSSSSSSTAKPLPLLAKNVTRLEALGFVVEEDGKSAVYQQSILSKSVKRQK